MGPRRGGETRKFSRSFAECSVSMTYAHTVLLRYSVGCYTPPARMEVKKVKNMNTESEIVKDQKPMVNAHTMTEAGERNGSGLSLEDGPLSPALSPLVPPGERENSRPVNAHIA